MKHFSLLRFCGLLVGSVGLAYGQAALPAFYEVVPLTFQWHRNIDTRTNTKVTGPVISPDPIGDTDPVPLVTTDVVRTTRDLPVGDNTFFTDQLRQFAGAKTGDFEILAVREPARNVQELVTNPYKIYITQNPRSANGIYFQGIPTRVPDYSGTLFVSPIDTGMTLVLGPALGNYTETYDAANNIKKVAGNVATTFSVKYSTNYRVNFDSAIPYHEYNLKASGTANFSIRTLSTGIAGMPPVFAPAAMKITGIGIYDHRYYATPTDKYHHVGLSSVTILMGQAKLMARERFPFFPDEPEAPPAP